jgi:rRNA maturation RNase YbeY
MSKIIFFQENLNFKHPYPRKIKNWINHTVSDFNYQIESLNIIFCTDDYLLDINQKYLRHNSYTDIITFSNSDVKGIIESDIFISIERVKQNAENLGLKFINELNRVIIHGVLHLVGFKDKTELQKQKMRLVENNYLQKLKSDVPRGTS